MFCKKMSRFIIVAIMFNEMSIYSHALSTNDGEHVMLQASIILDEPFYQGRTVEKDVYIRLRAQPQGTWLKPLYGKTI